MSEGVIDHVSFTFGGAAGANTGPVSILYAFKDFLIASAEVAAIAKGGAYPRRAPRDAQLPLLVLHKISEVNFVFHSGRTAAYRTRIQVDAFGELHFDVERLIAAIVKRANGFAGMMGNNEVQYCFLEDTYDGGSSDGVKDIFEHDMHYGSADFLIGWIGE